MKRYTVGVIAMTLLLGACAGSAAVGPYHSALSLEDEVRSDGQAFRRIAVISHYGDPVVFDAPGTARVGERFDARITTYGGGCISEDTIIVSASGLNAEVVPMQSVRMGVVCTAELRISPRPVSMVFSEPGVATIRVTGRAAPGDSLIAVRRRVQVVH